MIALGVALLVGAVCVTLAHMAGVVARHFRNTCSRPAGVWVGLLQLSVATMLVDFLCYGVAVLRQGYLTFVMRPDPSLSALIENEQVAEAAAGIVLNTALGPDGWIFLAINLAIVSCGVFASYYAHDPHPDYEAADRDRIKADKDLDAVKLKHGAAEASEKRRVARQLERLGA